VAGILAGCKPLDRSKWGLEPLERLWMVIITTEVVASKPLTEGLRLRPQ
jgi:hypothetical protein